MKIFGTSMVVVAMALMMGCSTPSIIIEDDDGARSTGQALEMSEEQCKEQCMEEFHACRNSPERGGGPGASGCAHQKNSCEDSC